MLALRMALLSFVKRVGIAALLPLVDGEGGGQHLLHSGDSRSFDLGLMSCHVLSLMPLCVPRPAGLRQLHLDLLLSQPGSLLPFSSGALTQGLAHFVFSHIQVKHLTS